MTRLSTMLDGAKLQAKVWLGDLLYWLKTRRDGETRAPRASRPEDKPSRSSAELASVNREILRLVVRHRLRQAEKMECLAAELHGSIAGVPSTSDLQNAYQADGPSRPRRRILSKMLESIPGHVEIVAISINGQTGRVYVETYHEGLENTVEFDVHAHEKDDPYLPPGG